jgi:hypothetical protein
MSAQRPRMREGFFEAPSTVRPHLGLDHGGVPSLSGGAQDPNVQLEQQPSGLLQTLAVRLPPECVAVAAIDLIDRVGHTNAVRGNRSSICTA